MDVSEGQITWMDVGSTSQSTSLPEITEEKYSVVTLVIFIISALVSITALFGIAIFIDCRQRKLDEEHAKIIKKRKIRLKLPRFGSARREDEDCIIEGMQEDAPSCSKITV